MYTVLVDGDAAVVSIHGRGDETGVFFFEQRHGFGENDLAALGALAMDHHFTKRAVLCNRTVASQKGIR